MVLRFGGGCPVCSAADGTAEHFLEAHAVPRIHEGLPPNASGALWLLRTDLPSDVLRRNVRLVGELIHGRQNWGWLRAPVTPGPEADAEAEPLPSAAFFFFLPKKRANADLATELCS